MFYNLKCFLLKTRMWQHLRLVVANSRQRWWVSVVGNDGGQVWWAMQSQSLLMASSDPCHQGKDIAAAIKEMFLRNKDIFMKFSKA